MRNSRRFTLAVAALFVGWMFWLAAFVLYASSARAASASSRSSFDGHEFSLGRPRTHATRPLLNFRWNGLPPSEPHNAAPLAIQVITLQNDAGVPGAEVAAGEQAIVWAAAQLHMYWGTPLVEFGDNGWVVDLTDSEGSEGASPYHFSGYPGAVIPVPYQADLWFGVSHEVEEMLVDPTGNVVAPDGRPLEACDPVASYSMVAPNGLSVADFVTPAWFFGGLGPYDYDRLVLSAGQVLQGGY